MSMTELYGTVPNLPWHILMHMTKADINAFNRKFLIEVKHTMTEQDIEKQVKNGSYAREIWNAALDKAARECDKVLECKAAARIRELKK